MEEVNKFKYFAFISYSTKDSVWGKRLFRRLESYRMPATMCKEKGWKRKPIDPVFFAPYEIQPGDLPEELKKRLRESRHLIVIASPNSAQSEWVGKEMSYFHSLGRTNNIHFFIIDGIPHSNDLEKECYHPITKELNFPEILGANINEKFSLFTWINTERAIVQLVTKLLGVEFDSVWQRHKRMMIRHAMCLFLCFIMIIGGLIGVRQFSLPIDVIISLNETSYKNAALPPLSNAIISIDLDGIPSRSIIIDSVSKKGVFDAIPHSFLGKEARLKVNCLHYQSIDTILNLSNYLVVNMRRDENFYGQINFQLCDSLLRPQINIPMNIDGHKVVTDGEGKVSLSIPLKEQKPVYYVSSTVSLADDSIVMPCYGDENVILTK